MHTRSRAKALPSFTLLQLLGALAVMSLLAGVLLPFLIRSIDKVVNEREIAQLNAYDGALQQRIMRSGYIPSYTNFDWAWSISRELGVQVSSVTNNPRRQPRLFVTDLGMKIGPNGNATLPYQQTDL